MKTNLLILFPALCLTACAGSHPSSNDPGQTQSETLPDSSEVREPARVHTYLVNDYIDPNDPRILHRGHVVDVVEQDDRWNLNAAPNAGPGSGPVGLADQPNAAPNPYSAEFETELVQQRSQSQQLAAMGEQMTAELAKLQELALKSADAVSENATLRNWLNEVQQEIDELKPLPNPPVAPNAPKKPSWWNAIMELVRQAPQGTPVAEDAVGVTTGVILTPSKSLRLPVEVPASTNEPPVSAPATNPPPSQDPSALIPAPGEMSAASDATDSQP